MRVVLGLGCDRGTSLETVRKYMGTPAVAEAAALLASRGELVVEKHKYRGPDGKNATVSIARLNDG
ncbi:putative cobalamin (Vitamin B12) biosynthesis CbiG protein, truncated [Methylocaldum marinum]|uniref:Putative cobalamin (Vitamin B12) biosynthesis CbiG protein, truncated n=1 Tax=Methylocaldum marinum TaxID=1432792 RepID=A0A250KQS4_9GAMM|nr:cobalamin biosynthesis protein [Methylocaldum marinum]BBA33947.1 putative cobalamin (Vitamin B12) biosynthesis CbiG protein, truncated [Methylocaldum marinum]